MGRREAVPDAAAAFGAGASLETRHVSQGWSGLLLFGGKWIANFNSWAPNAGKSILAHAVSVAWLAFN